ncbi:MAG: flavodoxin-dependent (E)-4-hydroxy-3-methylbut-2-enyl-diphosphate synthase, partial [candidate division Zixibacteria bacterium]|nr:flavodoxin-dependent (E)-4-hydroxy-3-methylbut-2-enyl-diphosphate synthase [candidate division Zixibacteria bacterium]
MELNFPIQRRKSRSVKIGDVLIGGGFPIAVQSMTTSDTRDVEATVAQVNALFDAGADIVRLSVLNHDASDKLAAIKSRVSKPIVADIHFQYKLALKAIEAGFDKIRINPGNIGAEWKVREVTKAALERGVPIRIGVNSGSLPKDVLDKFGHDDPRAFCEAALREIRILE